jgi:hypothetical protein
MKHRGLLEKGAEREGHQNVQGQIRLLLGATLEGGGGGHECPIADRAVIGSNIQKRKGHQNVHWQIGLLLGATFNRGKDTDMSKGG